MSDRFIYSDADSAGITVERKTENIEKGIPGPFEMERAISRLAILPNPNVPEMSNPEDFVESPWTITAPPLVDPNVWDNAIVDVTDLADLTGTDPYLSRKNVRKHIKAMGQAITPYRSYAMVAEVESKLIIIDGHHRLMALWLLGQETAPVWKVTL